MDVCVECVVVVNPGTVDRRKCKVHVIRVLQLAQIWNLLIDKDGLAKRLIHRRRLQPTNSSMWYMRQKMNWLLELVKVVD